MKKWKSRFCMLTVIILAVLSITSFAANAKGGSGQYESADGWKVSYDPALMEAKEIKNGAKFSYTGDDAAEGSVTILFTEEKQPEELLYEMTEAWADQEEIRRAEGFFPGTQDKWSYWRIFNDKKTVGDAKVAIAGEYNGGCRRGIGRD